MEPLSNCHNCGEPLKSHWKMCPVCGKEYHAGVEAALTAVNKTTDDYLKSAKFYFENRIIHSTTKRGIEEALKELEEGIKQFPANTELLIAYGDCLNFCPGRQRDAIDTFTKLLQIDPENDIGYSLRASVNYSMTNYDLAIDDWSKAIEYRKDDSKYAPFSGHSVSLSSNYYNRGSLYKMQEKYELTIADLTKAAELTKISYMYNVYMEELKKVQKKLGE